MRSRRGYSLIEVVIVFVLIAIIGGLAYTQLRGPANTAVDAGNWSKLRLVASIESDLYGSRGAFSTDSGVLGARVENVSFSSSASTSGEMISIGEVGAAGALGMASITSTGSCQVLLLNVDGSKEEGIFAEPVGGCVYTLAAEQ